MNLLEFAWSDFKSQKVKSIFGIGGIAISLLLVSTVGILIDSLSFAYMDTTTAQVGNADISISKQISVDINFDLYFEQKPIEDALKDIEEIDYSFPRIMMLVDVAPHGNMDDKVRLIFYGINAKKEQDSGTMGDLFVCNPETTEKTDELYQGPIPDDHCIILQNTARKYNLTVGDTVTLAYTEKSKNFTVDAIVYQNLRFSSVESNVIITELHEAQSLLNEEGKISSLLATLKNRKYIYDTRDIDGTTEKVRAIGTKIQKAIGLDYTITLQKMSMLSTSEYMMMFMQMTLFFVTILATLISGILLNSILTTSIEERIREFGTLRTLGSRKSLGIILVLFQGVFMGLFGTIIGIAGSLAVVPILLDLLYRFVEFVSVPIVFVVYPETILQNFLIGMSITVFISLIPALKAGKVKIVDALDPFRKSQESDYYLEKEGSPNTKIILIGISISTIGLLIFIMFPRIMVTQNLSSILGLFIGLLLAVLLGMVMAFVGLVPLFEWILLQFFKPFIKKYHSIVQLSLRRNVRRNTGNAIMFSLAFSFIFYMSSILVIRENMITNMLEFQYGGDLVIYNQGSTTEKKVIDLNLFGQIKQSPMVKSAAPIVHNTFDVSEIIGTAFLATQEDIDIEALLPVFQNIFRQKYYDTYLGSITAYHNIQCGTIGINKSYVDMIPNDQFIWDSDSGSNIECFDSLFDDSRNDTIIIAKALAESIGVTELGQKVRMTFAGRRQNEYNGNATTMTVVGISGGMPGFWNFRSSEFSAWNGGVMMSLKNYMLWMNSGNLNNTSTEIDKIILKLESTSERSIDDTKSLINDIYGEQYSFLVDDNISKLNMATENDATIDIIMEIILMLTVIISLFGLISTMYSTLIERMFEVGLLRSMGLRTNNVRGIFISESLIVMLASGIMGVFIGSFIAYMMATNISLLSEMPTPFVINIPTLIRTFSISIGVCVIGVILITRKIKQWSIMDIFRSTF